MSAAELVVDASLALKWVVEEPYSAEAHVLLHGWRGHRRRHAEGAVGDRNVGGLRQWIGLLAVRAAPALNETPDLQ